MLCWLQPSRSSSGAVNEKDASASVNNGSNENPLRTSTPSILSELQSTEVRIVNKRKKKTVSDLKCLQIAEITETPDYEHLSISAVLHYCKCKILRPYLRLLGVMGLRPTGDDAEHSTCYSIVINLHTIQVINFMCVGYVLQYMACFRWV